MELKWLNDYSEDALGPIVVDGGNAQWVDPAWGTFVTNIQAGSILENNSGGSWVAGWLTNGGMTIGTSSTGTAYTGSGVMVDGITVTQAHIDTGSTYGPGLFSPTTGARYCNVN